MMLQITYKALLSDLNSEQLILPFLFYLISLIRQAYTITSLLRSFLSPLRLPSLKTKQLAYLLYISISDLNSV